MTEIEAASRAALTDTEYDSLWRYSIVCRRPIDKIQRNVFEAARIAVEELDRATVDMHRLITEQAQLTLTKLPHDSDRIALRLHAQLSAEQMREIRAALERRLGRETAARVILLGPQVEHVLP